MKKILSLFLALGMIISSVGYAAELPDEHPASPKSLIESVGSHMSTFGVYGDFTSEKLYRETLISIVEKHPELFTEVMKTLLSSTDKYGAYFTPDEAKSMLEDLSDSITGIGVSVSSVDGNIIIGQVLPDTPAERAGLKVGDRIISANGTSLLGMDLDTATSHIKGPVGTTVNLVVNRDMAGDISFSIVREIITTEPVSSKILDEKIGYIQIISFTTNTNLYVASALGDFRRAGINDIIIDVRNNGGGYYNEAIAIADLFLPNKAIISSEDHRVNILDKTYTAKGDDPNYNTVILMNEYSASASEVLSAALSENNAATLIGVNSYGKGTVQTMIGLANGGMMKYTTAFYLTPTGKNIEGVGLKPDISVENTMEDVDLSQFTALKYKHTYSVGMSDPEIKNAKEMLKFLGVYHGEVDEYFDENLKIVLTAIQKSSDYIEPNGVLNPVTQIEILDILCNTKIEKDNQMDAAIKFLTEK
ncbi:MAG: PDZ domain-containing protein [Ruminococcaceae bacterium]|nr:PDZ domain-containing protein [Oscillospiraceae bacterium]